MSQILGNTSITLNGTSNFSVGSDVYTWDDQWLGYVDIWSGNASLNANVTVNLAGSGWGIGALRINGAGIGKITITDSTTANNFQSIEHLYLNIPGSTSVTLGNMEVNNIYTGNSPVTITTGAGWVGSIQTHNGNDIINVGTGDVGSLYLAHGNNTVKAIGWVGSILAFNGNDIITLGAGGAESVNVGNGNNQVTTGTGWVGSITSYSGNDRVTIGSGGVGTIFTGSGSDVVRMLPQSDPFGGVMVDGSGGSDIFDFSALSANVTANISSGLAYVQTTQGSATLQSFESLIGGSGNDSFIGTSGANILEGRGGNDILNGLGGADTMRGGAGNDTYYVDALTDRVDESIAGSGGTDHIYSSVSLSLANTTVIKGVVENLTLSGTANLSAVGNASNNVLTGNSGSNSINGGAGNDVLRGKGGKDTLTGGAGNDFFVFDTAPNASTNLDRIVDFNVVQDTIRLENAIFTALGAPGVLAAAAFFKGAAAADANDRVIYNPTTGALIYDSNGNAAGGAVQFATLGTNLALTNADFQII